jgi:hypothetical protein
MFHEDGRRDGYDEANTRFFFCNFAQAPKNPFFLDSNWNLNSSINKVLRKTEAQEVRLY